MANAKKRTSKKKAQPKTTAHAKSGEPVIITFKKDAVSGALPPQAAGILALVKAAQKIERADLLKKMEGKIKTKQPMGVIWSFYRSQLVRGGFVAVTA
jgi:hypothetical protein